MSSPMPAHGGFVYAEDPSCAERSDERPVRQAPQFDAGALGTGRHGAASMPSSADDGPIGIRVLILPPVIASSVTFIDSTDAC